MATAAPQVSSDRDFFSSAYELGSSDAKRVFKAIDQLSADPNYPSLNLEPLKADGFPRTRSPDQDPAEYDEARALALSQLFVAMTRARDGFYLLCSGHPSEIVADGLDRFEVIDA